MAAKLKRSLGLPVVIFYGVGAILGAGIYVLIGEIAAAAGYWSPISFLLAATIGIFSAFSYAELSARFPRSAGEAVYVDQAFSRKRLTQLVGLLVVATGVISAATMATGIVGYVQLFIDWEAATIITVFLVIIGAIAIWGINESAWLVMVITLLEIAGLLYVVWIAGDNMLSFQLTEKLFLNPVNTHVASGVFLGSFLAFYAYIGFEDMVNIAEEIKQPETVLPVAILTAVILSTLLYIIVSIAALSVLPPERLANSTAPLADVVMAKGYSSAWIGFISLVAVINGAIVQLIMASRVIYGMARKELLPIGLATVHPVTATPIFATLVSISVTILLALFFPLASLAQATSVVVLTVFALTNLSLIRLNKQQPQQATVHYPDWIPCVGASLCVLMLVLKVVTLV